MIRPEGRVTVALRPPHDRMIGDRLRRGLRRLALAARTPFLVTFGVLSRRIRPAPSPARVSRILVVRTDRLGDMALTTAALQDLRDHFRKAEITVLAPAAPAALLEGHPAVDRSVVLESRRLPRDLAGRFDLAIDFTPDESLRGALIVAASRAPHRAGLSAFGRQAFFNVKAPRADRRRHIFDLNRSLVAAVGATPQAARPTLFVTAEERGIAQSLLASRGAATPRVAVHPGGRYASQRWSPERFADFITLLTGRTGAACVVLHGPGEDGLAARICASSPDALSLGPQSVRLLMALIASCDLFVGNNSGPLHVASALGVPTVSVMGPTDPARFSPRGPADRVVRRDLRCSPCERGRCWHHTCLRAIEPHELLGEAEEALRSLRPREEAR